jgi:hypothetical protein
MFESKCPCCKENLTSSSGHWSEYLNYDICTRCCMDDEMTNSMSNIVDFYSNRESIGIVSYFFETFTLNKLERMIRYRITIKRLYEYYYVLNISNIKNSKQKKVDYKESIKNKWLTK